MLLSLPEASAWATRRLARTVTPANLSYLVNYGRIKKIKTAGGAVVVDTRELDAYYNSWRGKRESSFKRRLGSDLNWRLSFEEYKEAETTKHVHRLHPYKGKFIPQLAEYFLDAHTDEWKTAAPFCPGDVVLDPFCGSGTTLVQANELGLHAVGVDVSQFNALITNLKLSAAPPEEVRRAAADITQHIARQPAGAAARAFDAAILEELKVFNGRYFPVPEYKRAVREGRVNEEKYGMEKAEMFAKIYRKKFAEFGLSETLPRGCTASGGEGGFLDTWYFQSARQEIFAANARIQKIKDAQIADMLRLILSRTIRSSRATTHADLATLREPVLESYYCAKHGKICKPLLSILSWWKRYSQDTAARLSEFSRLKTNTRQMCVAADARAADLPALLAKQDAALAKAAAGRQIAGVFSSPPYVGLINYHEQHAYAYELFNLRRREADEIGILEKGAGKAAREEYAAGVAAVLVNCRRYLKDGFDIFLVANDKFNLYGDIAARAELQIVKEYKRPVINRAEGAKGAYGETIFQMKAN